MPVVAAASVDRERGRPVDGSPSLHALLAACGGFLLSTLWFDLMFDVQVRGHAPASAVLPEAVIASIAAYYRRVTTDAHPMGMFVGGAMMVAIAGSLWSLRHAAHRAWRWAAMLAAVFPIGLAALRVFPNAVRLGARIGPLAEQSALARSICTDHLVCLASIALFTVIQIGLAGARSRAPR